MSFHPTAKIALEQINFAKRFESLCRKYNKPKGIARIDKKELLNRLQELGYSFKYADRCIYLIEDWHKDIKSHTVFQLRYGIFLGYFNIAVHNEYLDLNSGNFGSIAYFLDKELTAPGMPVFTSHEEFKAIAQEVMAIYEDFKEKFLLAFDDVQS